MKAFVINYISICSRNVDRFDFIVISKYVLQFEQRSTDMCTAIVYCISTLIKNITTVLGLKYDGKMRLTWTDELQTMTQFTRQQVSKHLVQL